MRRQHNKLRQTYYEKVIITCFYDLYRHDNSQCTVFKRHIKRALVIVSKSTYAIQ